MNPTLKKLFLALSILCGALPVTAQSLIEAEGPGPVIFISQGNKNHKEIINIFKETQRPHFHDPGAPRFLLTDEKGKWALGIGGYIQTKIEYDFSGAVDNVDFYPSLIANGKPRNQLQMDVTTSTLFLKLVGKTRHLGNFIVYTAGNWRGDGKNFNLQNAYIQFLGFTIGYDTGTFMDLAACPPTIDYAGPCGMTFYRSTLVRYEHPFGKHLSAGIAIETPNVVGETGSFTTLNRQRYPQVPLYMQYQWDKGKSHVRITGIYRNITYSDLKADRTENKNGWGVQVSTVLKGCKAVQFFGQYTYGKGIGELLNDLSNLNVDLVPESSTEGKLQVLPMAGWYAGLQYNFSPTLFTSATYSQSRLYSRELYKQRFPEQYKSGQYLVGNLFWNISPSLQIGIEYLHGWRKDFNKTSSTANRMNASAQFSF